ncbi:MAG: LacI family DNA-binding transcriptional regulator [Candidatus Bathyarchaeia archaeon]
MPNPPRNRLTIKKLAQICGVSVGTVSAVINNRLGVKSTTREHVLNVIRQTGFISNPWARKLQGKGSRYFALVTPLQVNIYQDSNIKQITYSLLQHQIHSYVIPSKEKVITELPILPIDAYLFIHTQPAAECKFPYPSLIFDPPYPDTIPPYYKVIIPDRRYAGELAARQFIAMGCRRFAWLGNKNDTSQKLQGFKTMLAQYGYSILYLWDLQNKREFEEQIATIPSGSLLGIWAEGFRISLSFLFKIGNTPLQGLRDFYLIYWGNPSLELPSTDFVNCIGTSRIDLASLFLEKLKEPQPGRILLTPQLQHSEDISDET